MQQLADISIFERMMNGDSSKQMSTTVFNNTNTVMASMFNMSPQDETLYVEYVASGQFSEAQLHEIKRGLDAGFDVSVYVELERRLGSKSV